MTGTLHADTIEKANGDPVNLTKQSAAKAWMNMNATGTPSFNDSFNASSITDNSTGNQTIHHASSFSDGWYSTTLGSSYQTTQNSSLEAGIHGSDNHLAGSYRIETESGDNNTVFDCEMVTGMNVGDLA